MEPNISPQLDLKSGYWQVPIKEEDKEKTAFRTSSGQLYEFNQLPFGLCNAPAIFSRLMDRTLAGLAWNYLSILSRRYYSVLRDMGRAYRKT